MERYITDEGNTLLKRKKKSSLVISFFPIFLHF